MTKPEVEVTLRIPGRWAHPSEMVQRMPKNCKWQPESMTMPDGHRFEIHFRDADDDFVSVFASMCRREPTEDEKAIIEGYTVQVCLTGPGGSFQAAHALMRAAAAMIRAGGGGVFTDNSGVSFGGSQWCSLTDDGGNDAMGFAFVGIIRGKNDAFTTGMHIMGLPDIVMRPADLGEDGGVIIEMIQYLCEGQREVGDGHIVADLNGPRFRVAKTTDEKNPPNTPIHNPFGRLRLTSMKEIAESN